MKILEKLIEHLSQSEDTPVLLPTPDGEDCILVGVLGSAKTIGGRRVEKVVALYRVPTTEGHQMIHVTMIKD